MTGSTTERNSQRVRKTYALQPFASLLQSLPVSERIKFEVNINRRQSNISKVTSKCEKEENVLSFVYGQLQYGCEKHPNCPIRFENKESQQQHYKNNDVQTTPYSCRSCSRSDRLLKFTSKANLIEHKTSPDFILGPKLEDEDWKEEGNKFFVELVRKNCYNIAMGKKSRR